MSSWGDLQTVNLAERMHNSMKAPTPVGWQGASEVWVRDCGCIYPALRTKKRVRYCRYHRRRFPLTTHSVSDEIYKLRVRFLIKTGKISPQRPKKAKN